MLKKLANTERGSTLVLVLVFTAALLFLGGALMTYAMSDKAIADRQEDNTRLYYIAEAGIEAGVAAKSRNFNYTTPITSTLGGGTYEVTFIDDGSGPELAADERIVISKGILDGRQLILMVICKRVPWTEKALMVSNKLTLHNVRVFGNLHVNDALHIHKSNSEVRPYIISGEEGELVFGTGDFSYGGDRPTFQAGGELRLFDDEGNLLHVFAHIEHFIIDGEEPFKVPKVALPDIPEIYNTLKNQTEGLIGPGIIRVLPADYLLTNRLFSEGSLTIRPQDGDPLFDFDGLMVVEGNFVIDPQKKDINVNLTGTIMVKGNVQIKGKVNEGREDGNLTIISTGKIELFQETFDDAPEQLYLGGNILFMATENINFLNKSLITIHGTLISDSMIDLENVDLYYIPDVFEESETIGFGVVIKEWIRP